MLSVIEWITRVTDTANQSVMRVDTANVTRIDRVQRE